jgi:DNA-binding NarL/FixJ family response regulator
MLDGQMGGSGQPPLRVLVIGAVGFMGDAIEDALAAVAEVELVGRPVPDDEALDAAAAEHPEVALLDAEAVGDEWLGLVRDLVQAHPGITVIVLSWQDEVQVLAAIGAGARGYLTKDLSAEALARAVAGIRHGELAMSRRTAAIALQGIADRRAWTAAAASADPLLARLTPREREVLQMIARGMRDREIAEELSLSVRTVESHVAQVLRRLHVRSRAQAAMRYMAEVSAEPGI